MQLATSTEQNMSRPLNAIQPINTALKIGERFDLSHAKINDISLTATTITISLADNTVLSLQLSDDHASAQQTSEPTGFYVLLPTELFEGAARNTSLASELVSMPSLFVPFNLTQAVPAIATEQFLKINAFELSQLPFNGSLTAMQSNASYTHMVAESSMPLDMVAVSSAVARIKAEFVASGLNVTAGNLLDVDGDGDSDALTDALTIVKYLLDFRGNDLVAGSVDAGGVRPTAALVESYLAELVASGKLDIDGNGVTDALTDGLLILRGLFGFTGSTLTSGAIGNGATRTDPSAITDYITSLKTNDAPSLVGLTTSIDEGSANGTVVVDINDALTGNDTDVDMQPLTYAITAGNGSGAFAINAATGVITVVNSSQLVFETNPVFSLTVSASDGVNTSNATVVITLNDIVTQRPPVITDHVATIDENSANGTVVANVNDDNTAIDKDIDGDVLTYSITAGNSNGAFAIDAATGEITVADSTKLNFETTPSFSLTVLATDGNGNSDTATITVNLTNLNDQAPSIANAALTINENSLNGAVILDINDVNTGNDKDVDGAIFNDAITYHITGNDSGAFAINATTGVITVADSTQLDFETTTRFNLTVFAEDGNGNSDTATITINLNNVNDNGPTINDTTLSLDENPAVVGGFVYDVSDVITQTDTDRDLDALSYELIDGNESGTFAIDKNTGVISIAKTALIDFETLPNQFTLIVLASDGLFSDTAKITININDLNDQAPAIADGAVTIDENTANGTVVFNMNDVNTGTDVDIDGAKFNDAIVYSLTDNANGAFAIDAATGEISVADASQLDADTVQSFTLNVLATDGAGNSDTATVTVNLTDLNDLGPVIDDVVLALHEKDAATFAYDVNDAITGGDVDVENNSTDVDANVLTYSITDGNNGAFTIDAATGVITVADAALLAANGSYALTVQAMDTNGNSDTAVITVNLNRAPVLENITVALDENSDKGSFVANLNEVLTNSDLDIDGEAVTYAITTGNDNGAFEINAATGVISVLDSTQLDFETAPTIVLTVSATDPHGNNNSATVTINLDALNDNAPVFITQPVGGFNINENDPANTVIHPQLATDADGSALTYSIISGNESGNFVLNPSTGALSIIDPAAGNPGTHTLGVVVTDGVFVQITTFTINVADVAPIIADQVIAINENTINGTVVGTVTDTNTANTGTTYSLTTNPNGAFAIDSATGVITVKDSSQLNFEASRIFTLTVLATEASGLTDTATVTVNLNDLNDLSPVIDETNNRTMFDLDVNTIPANGTLVGNINDLNDTDQDATVDSDIEGNPLTYTILNQGSANGAFGIDAAGNITVINNAAINFQAGNVFFLTISSSDGVFTDVATITVNLIDDEEAPVVHDATLQLTEAATVADADANPNNGIDPVIIDLADANTGTDRDIENDPVLYSIVSGNDKGFFAIDQATGKITVTAAGEAGLDFDEVGAQRQYILVIKATGTSLNGPSDLATVTLNITNANDQAPIIDAVGPFSINETSSTGLNAASQAQPGAAVVNLSDSFGNGGVADDFDIEGDPAFYDLISVFAIDDNGNRHTVNGLGQSYADAFIVNHDTGVVALSNNLVALNFEQMQGLNGKLYVSVQAHDGFGNFQNKTVAASDGVSVTGITTFLVNIGNLNEHSPDVFAINPADGSEILPVGIDHPPTVGVDAFEVALDIGHGAPAGTFIAHLNNSFDPAIGGPNESLNSITALDHDADGNTISYSIVGGNTNGTFSIDQFGVIRVATGMTVDQIVPFYDLQIVATDNLDEDGDPATHDNLITIHIDVHGPNTAPVFNLEGNGRIVSIDELLPSNNNLGTLQAYSLDAGATDANGDVVTYQITSGNELGAFTINPYTGQITIADPTKINFEAVHSFELTVAATDGVATTTALFTINVNDKGAELPAANFYVAIDEPLTIEAVGEANAFLVGDMNDLFTGTDVTGEGRPITNYAIVGGNGNTAFFINATTGKIYVNNQSELNLAASGGDDLFTLTIRASDGFVDTLQNINIHLNHAPNPSIGGVDTNVVLTLAEFSQGFVANIQDFGSIGSNHDHDIDEQFADATLDTVTYKIISINGDTAATGGDFNAFIIQNSSTNGGGDGLNGLLFVNDSSLLDIDNNTRTFAIVVEANDNRGTTNSIVLETITIQLTDAGPTINNQTVVMLSTVTNGDELADVNDANTNDDFDQSGDPITYSITGVSVNGVVAAIDSALFKTFVINASTGRITLADSSQLDFTTSQRFDITVQASDGNIDTADTAIITISNRTNNEPNVPNVTVSIDEHSTGSLPDVLNDAVTGNDLDIDGDQIWYAILNINGDTATDGGDFNAFTINPTTGVLTVNDSSLLSFANTPTFSILVEYTDGTFTKTMTAVVQLNNVGPLINDQAFALNENSVNSTVVGNINDARTATDNDIDGNAISYSIISGNELGGFAINAATGAITVADASKLDFEARHQFVLVVQATAGGLSDTATVTIALNNVDDNGPVVDDVVIAINENSANGTTVLNVNDTTGDDTDADGDAITYSLVSINGVAPPVTPAFAVAANGTVTIVDTNQLDFETTPEFVLVVRATSTGTGGVVTTDDATVLIKLNNLNDNAPDIDSVSNELFSGGNTIPLDENSLADGQLLFDIGDINKITLDDIFDNAIHQSGPNDTDRDGNQIVYSLVTNGDPANNAFVINTSTGVVTVNNPALLNFETTPVFNLVVTGSDGTFTDTVNLTVNLANVNEAPIINDSTTSFSVKETIAAGTTIINVNDALGGDFDIDGNAITYSLTGTNVGGLVIDAATGVVSVGAGGLDYEMLDPTPLANGTFDFTFEVTATDGSLTDVQQFNVNLADVGPQTSNGNFSVNEAASGLISQFTFIGNMDDLLGTNTNDTATFDTTFEGNNITYSIISGNTGSAFSLFNSLGGNDGGIYVNIPTAIDYNEALGGTQQFVLGIRATDTNGTFMDSTAIITITNDPSDGLMPVPSASLTLADVLVVDESLSLDYLKQGRGSDSSSASGADVFTAVDLYDAMSVNLI